MKVIFSIAKNEFRYLFYSPVAWFVLLVFLVQCGYFYTDTLYGIANSQELMLKNVPSFKGFDGSLTKTIFLMSEFFPNIMRNLFLFIPILTMGLISRENHNGTNALLFSSPVSIRRIVLGKYAGIMLYNLLLVLVIAILMLAATFSIQKVDHGALLSALLGFYLLVCAYSAIGLFMSSLSSYQVVSALATFMAIFILSRIGNLWQQYDLVRDLTWFLSLQDRTGNMLKGLIVTKDILYFILVSFMFLAFTYFRLAGQLEYRPWLIKTGRYIATIIIVLLLGYTSSRPALTGYLDATAAHRNTISPVTQGLLKNFGDSTVEVTLYTNLYGEGRSRGMPESRNMDYLHNFWESYIRFRPEIKFNYVYYYDYDPAKDDSTLFKRFPGKSMDEIARETCEMMDINADMFMPVSAIQDVPGLRAESSRLVMQLKYQGRTAWLRTYQDREFWPNELHSISAFKRLLGEPMPAIAFSSGSLERNIYKTGEREYAFHTTYRNNRMSLLNLGFDLDTVNLPTEPLPDNISALVIADPKMELDALAQERLNHHIDKGGNLMVFGEPGKQYVTNPLLLQLGVQLENGQLVVQHYDETPDKVASFLTEDGKALVKAIPGVKLKSDTIRLQMQGATTISSTGMNGWENSSLSTTFPNRSWLKKGSLVIDSILPPFDPKAGDIKMETFPTVRGLTRKTDTKEQRILVTGDADFTSNLRYGANINFVLTAYSWMSGNRFPVFVPSEPDMDILLTIGERAAHYQKIVFIWILPAIIGFTGTVLLIRRKRK